MKIKFLFFDWLVQTEEGLVINDGIDSKNIPPTWTDDAIRDYKIIKYLTKYLKYRLAP